MDRRKFASAGYYSPKVNPPFYNAVLMEDRREGMDLVMTTLIGVAVGAIAELLLAVHEMRELILTVVLGVCGALLTRYIGVTAGWFEAGDATGFVASVAGAVTLLLVYGVLFRKWLMRT